MCPVMHFFFASSFLLGFCVWRSGLFRATAGRTRRTVCGSLTSWRRLWWMARACWSPFLTRPTSFRYVCGLHYPLFSWKPFWGTVLPEVSIGRDLGALKGLTHRIGLLTYTRMYKIPSCSSILIRFYYYRCDYLMLSINNDDS